MLAQEVNYIEWRFKLDKSFGSKKHFLKLIRAVFLTFVIHTKTNENDKENPEKNEWRQIIIFLEQKLKITYIFHEWGECKGKNWNLICVQKYFRTLFWSIFVHRSLGRSLLAPKRRLCYLIPLSTFSNIYSFICILWFNALNINLLNAINPCSTWCGSVLTLPFLISLYIITYVIFYLMSGINLYRNFMC